MRDDGMVRVERSVGIASLRGSKVTVVAELESMWSLSAFWLLLLVLAGWVPVWGVVFVVAAVVRRCLTM